MSKISLIHLSDIHFMKESGNSTDLDMDIREELLRDIRINAKEHLDCIKGILVCGDIAFAGSTEEYEKAQEFLEQITECLGISNSSVYCVPGNHDVDQSIVKNSNAIKLVHEKIENTKSLRYGDKEFADSITDGSYGEVLFTSIEAYNNFASRYNCNINKERLYWTSSFKLDEDLSLNLHGINSSFISNSLDNWDKRKMFVGEAQKPKRKDNAVNMLLCHHPPECWMFSEEILPKMNKRAEIQLFGHMHDQVIIATEDNIIINSGATHPVRDDTWHPRYNWISIDSTSYDRQKSINVEIFPRVLGDNDDKFVSDKSYCKGEKSVIHSLTINKSDKETQSKSIQNTVVNKVNKTSCINRRDVWYKFFDLSYINQISILLELELLDETDRDKKFVSIFERIYKKAEKEDKLQKLWNRINS